MDEATLELLSRYLDDDLVGVERSALEERLSSDPRLRDRLGDLRRGREAVAALAARERHPAALDALVEPLRRAPAERMVVRPVFRWLAAAASVAAAALLALQLVRQHPQPTVTVRAQPVARSVAQPSPGHYYQLKPLPRGKDADQAPIGAADRLLRDGPATPVPEPLPPLEVMGPLEEPKPSSAAASRLRQEEAVSDSAASVAVAPAGEREPSSDEVVEGAPAAGVGETPGKRLEVAKAGRQAAPAQAAAPGSPSLPGVLVVHLTTGVVRVPIARLPPGASPVDLRIEVHGERITRALPSAPDGRLPGGIATALAGTPAPGVGDGTYAARVEAAPRPQ